MDAPVTTAELLAARTGKPEYAASGLVPLDAVLGGFARGAVAEIAGGPSSGKTSIALSALAAATSRRECCAYVDIGGSLQVESALSAGADLDRWLWVRADGRLEVALQAADLLLHGGGFGLICLDLGEMTDSEANRIPLSYWYRYRRAVENTRTVFLVVTGRAIAGSCAACRIRLEGRGAAWSGAAPGRLFRGVTAECLVAKPGPPRAQTIHLRAA